MAVPMLLQVKKELAWNVRMPSQARQPLTSSHASTPKAYTSQACRQCSTPAAQHDVLEGVLRCKPQ